MPVWVYIALAVPVLILAALHLLKFHFSLDVQTPATFKGAVGVSFLWMRKEMVLDAGQAISTLQDEAEETIGSPIPDETSDPNGPVLPPHSDQRGAVGVPDSWVASAARFRLRVKNAFRKMSVDWRVWRALALFVLDSGRRVLGLLSPALKSLRVGMADVYDLGRFAASWSVVTGTYPALACPVEYGFADRSFSLKARIAGGFSGLSLLAFGLMTVFRFPWRVMGRRFLDSWRNPELNRWQRRVLLP